MTPFLRQTPSARFIAGLTVGLAGVIVWWAL